MSNLNVLIQRLLSDNPNVLVYVEAVMCLEQCNGWPRWKGNECDSLFDII